MKLTSLIKYGKFFSNRKFLSFASNLSGKFVFMRRALILFYCLRDSDTPKYVKVIIAGALGYLMAPIDILPDTIAGLGWLDDMAVLGLAFKVANKYVKDIHKDKAKKFVPFGKENMD